MAPPRPHLLARSRFAERACRAVEWSWTSGLCPKPQLDPEFLWRKGSAGFNPADALAGRSAADAADFNERLARLCRSLEHEARLNPLGHAMAFGQLTAAIRTRHRLGRLWSERPELAAAPIAPPIIVVGQMRSGTTRMHRLLAADPRHAGTRFCNGVEPVPRRPDTRPLRSALALALARQVNPWLDTLHPFGARRIDEEIGWLAWALNPCAFEAQWRIPGFVTWSEGHDPSPVYREFARILRTDAATMGNAARPRVLKCPQYAEDLTALLARFPDARVVVTRRDAGDVQASTVSVVASQMVVQSEGATLAEIDADWRRKLAFREARTAAAVVRFQGPVAEVEFEALGRNWCREMARVYRTLGLELTPAALAAMEREQAGSRRSAHRLHGNTYRRLARA